MIVLVTFLGQDIEFPTYLPKTAWLRHGPFAIWLIKASRPTTIVELGTHHGYSYFSFCQAVREVGLPTKCFAVDTWQGDEHSGFYGNDVFEAVHKHNSRYDDFSTLLRKSFSEAVHDIPDGTVDILHIDGRHFYEDVKYDFEIWKVKLSSRAIVLFHDTEVYDRDFGVWKFWTEIRQDRPSFNFNFQYGLGVLFLGNKSDHTEAIQAFLELLETEFGQDSVNFLFHSLGNRLFECSQSDMEPPIVRRSVSLNCKRKRIFLHIGLPKTGTSALQAFFSRNVNSLAQHGVSYPWPESELVVASGVCSGNLLHIMTEASKIDGFIEDFDKVVARYFISTVKKAIAVAPKQTVLLSGEFISANLYPEVISELQELSSQNDLTIICFVRDVYDYTMSAWKQRIKTGFSGFEGQGPFVWEGLQVLLNSSLDIRFRNYDSVKEEIIATFLSELGLDATDFDQMNATKSNPSLSFWQATAIVKANRITGLSRLSAILLDRFRNMPDTEPDPYFHEVDSALLQLLDSIINKVNLRLPTDERLRTTPRLGIERSVNAMPMEIVMEILLTMHEVFAAGINNNSAETFQQPYLPSDFDPQEYLLLNYDVREAGVDPVHHYVNHGRFEGRSYRMQMRENASRG